MGVNDLAKAFYQECEARNYDHCEPYLDRGNRCPDCPAEDGDSIRATAEQAWHPVSSRADAKEAPQETVLMRNIDGGVVMDWGPNLLANWDIFTHWARIRDVVLLPPDTHD